MRIIDRLNSENVEENPPWNEIWQLTGGLKREEERRWQAASFIKSAVYMWAAEHLISIEIEFLFKSCPATWLESLSTLGCIDDIHKDPSHAPFSSYIFPSPSPDRRQSRIVKIRFYEERCIYPTCEHNVFYVRAWQKCVECFFFFFFF